MAPKRKRPASSIKDAGRLVADWAQTQWAVQSIGGGSVSWPVPEAVSSSSRVLLISSANCKASGVGSGWAWFFSIIARISLLKAYHTIRKVWNLFSGCAQRRNRQPSSPAAPTQRGRQRHRPASGRTNPCPDRRGWLLVARLSGIGQQLAWGGSAFGRLSDGSGVICFISPNP